MKALYRPRKVVRAGGGAEYELQREPQEIESTSQGEKQPGRMTCCKRSGPRQQTCHQVCERTGQIDRGTPYRAVYECRGERANLSPGRQTHAAVAQYMVRDVGGGIGQQADCDQGRKIVTRPTHIRLECR